MNGYALAYRSQVENEGKTLPPGSLVWRSAYDLHAALISSEPKSWDSSQGPTTLCGKMQLAHLYAEAGLTWEARDEPIFLFRIRLRKQGQGSFTKSTTYAGGEKKLLKGWVTQTSMTIYGRCVIAHRRGVYGEADPATPGFRFWPRPSPFDEDVPKDHSLVVAGPPEVRGTCVFDLTTVYEDWTRSIPIRHEATRFSWDPKGSEGRWQKFIPDATYPARWEPTPTIFDKLIEG